MNIFFPPNQNIVFLNMALLGIVIGILYDVFSIKRSFFGDGFAVCFADDIIFVAISGILFLTAVFVTNNGVIRWYEFFACMLSFFVYKATVSVLVMKVMRFVAGIFRFVVKKVFGFVLFVLIKPVFVIIAKIAVYSFKPLMLYFKRELEKGKIVRSFKNVCE